MKKFMIWAATFLLYSFVGSTASATTLLCESVEGKSALVKITSETIDNEDVYANLAEVEFSEMADEDLNGKAFGSQYIRDEGNNEVPVVLSKLSEHDDDTDFLTITFAKNDLKEAQLSYYNIESEISITLSQLSCVKI